MWHSITKFFLDLLANRIIVAAFSAWLAAQVLKVIIELIRYRSFNWRRLFGSGGMPSSHSACVSAVVMMTCRLFGVASPECGIASVFAFIVIFDAVNVRRAAGTHAQILNSMMQNADKQTPELYGRELKESLGHTPFQALMGILLGILVALIM